MHVERLRSTAARDDFVAGDWRRADFLSADHFYDRMHLNATGAAIYSRRLSTLVDSVAMA
jgi:hypothetical protein